MADKITTIGIKLKNRRIVLHHNKTNGVVVLSSKKLIDRDVDVTTTVSGQLPALFTDYAVSEEGAEAVLVLLTKWYKNKDND